MTGRVVLVLGGARSGKSQVAEAMAAATGEPVTYVATGTPVDAEADPSWATRVTTHRSRRPAGWVTVEGDADLPAALDGAVACALVDSLGPWVARAPGFVVDAPALCSNLAARRRRATTVLVSDEVGLGVVPATEIGNAFRDAVGDLNRAVAAVADDVLLVVAGRTLRLDRP